MAFVAFETQISIGRGATPTWTNLAGVTGTSLPSFTADLLETTSFDTANRGKDFIAGRVDAGEISVEMNWTLGATDTLLNAILASGEKVQIRFTIKKEDSGEEADMIETWNAICTGYERTVDPSEVATASATFKITTKVVAP